MYNPNDIAEQERTSLMRPEFISLYAIYSTENEYGKKGGCVGYFSDYYVAKEEAEGKGYYGSIGIIQSKTGIKIEDEVYLLENSKPIDLDNKQKKIREELKKQALAKLSTAEKKALGIYDE